MDCSGKCPFVSFVFVMMSLMTATSVTFAFFSPVNSLHQIGPDKCPKTLKRSDVSPDDRSYNVDYETNGRVQINSIIQDFLCLVKW